MIPEEFLKRQADEWAPFMERLEKSVRLRKRAKAGRIAAAALIAGLSLFMLFGSGRGRHEESFLSARIPAKGGPSVSIEGGCAVERERGVWVVFDTGVRK